MNKQLYKHIAFGIAEVIHDPILTGTAPGWIEEFGTGEISLADLTKNLNRLGFPQDKFVLGRVENLGQTFAGFRNIVETFEVDNEHTALPPFSILAGIKDKLIRENFKKKLLGEFAGQVTLIEVSSKSQILEKLPQSKFDLLILDMDIYFDKSGSQVEIFSQGEILLASGDIKIWLVDKKYDPALCNAFVDSLRAQRYLKLSDICGEEFFNSLRGALEEKANLILSLLRETERGNNQINELIRISTASIEEGILKKSRRYIYTLPQRKKAIEILKNLGGEGGLRALVKVLEHYASITHRSEMTEHILDQIRILAAEVPVEILSKLMAETSLRGAQLKLEQILNEMLPQEFDRKKLLAGSQIINKTVLSPDFAGKLASNWKLIQPVVKDLINLGGIEARYKLHELGAYVMFGRSLRPAAKNKIMNYILTVLRKLPPLEMTEEEKIIFTKHIPAMVKEGLERNRLLDEKSN